MIRLEARINGTELSLEADELIGGDEAERYLAAWDIAVERVLAARAPSPTPAPVNVGRPWIVDLLATNEPQHDHHVPEPDDRLHVQVADHRCSCGWQR